MPAKRQPHIEINAVQLLENARQWLASPEGQNALADSQKQAEEASARFREAQRIDPDILNKPVTR